jgi:hypothetical protein
MQLARDRVPPIERLSHGRNALAVFLIVGMAPMALMALCAAARAYASPWLMPTTILYPAIGYAAAVLCVCAVDGLRR